MKKQSQDLTNEQLHIEDAAAVQEEYSLEDIMNEFGGWSKRSEPRTPPLDTAQTLPEQKPEQRTPAEEADAPDTKIVRFPAQAKRFPEEKEEKPPKNPADFTGQTIRFTPIREEQTQQAEKPKIWTYQAEPDPEPAPPSAMAVPTPAILPTPTREAVEIIRARKEEIAPSWSGGSETTRMDSRNMRRGRALERIKKYRPVPMRRAMRM